MYAFIFVTEKKKSLVAKNNRNGQIYINAGKNFVVAKNPPPEWTINRAAANHEYILKLHKLDEAVL